MKSKKVTKEIMINKDKQKGFKKPSSNSIAMNKKNYARVKH